MKFTKIKNIKYIGKIRTLDLTMSSKFHNFVANGLVTSNSHAVGYAMCSYKTAYLKYHYPAEFYAASCNRAIGDIHKSDFDEIKDLINDAKLFGIKFLPPSIQHNNKNFLVKDKKHIIYSLSWIRNIGDGSMPLLDKLKDTTTFNEFLVKSNEIGLKKSVIEALICSGALDNFKITRNKMLYDFELLNSLTEKEQALVISNLQNNVSIDKSIAQLIDENTIDARKKAKIVVPNAPRRKKIGELYKEYILKDKFETIFHIAMYERKFLGTDISVNETDGIMANITHDCLEITKLTPKTKLRTIVYIERLKEHLTKNGKNPGQPMAFMTGGDGTYSLDNIVIFPTQYGKFKPFLKEGNVVQIDGMIGDNGGVIANNIYQIR